MSENGRLRQGAGGYARGTRRRSGLMLTSKLSIRPPQLKRAVAFYEEQAVRMLSP